MANKKMYAWTDIKYSTSTEDVTTRHLFRCGKEVTQAALGITDKQWEELVRTKSVRDIPYPVPSNTNPISPVQHFRKMAKLVEENSDDLSLLQSVLPPLDEAPTAQTEAVV